jgi:hypothetical protein
MRPLRELRGLRRFHCPSDFPDRLLILVRPMTVAVEMTTPHHVVFPEVAHGGAAFTGKGEKGMLDKNSACGRFGTSRGADA